MSKTLDVAQGLLARREHSQKELVTKLVKRGVSQSEASTVVCDLARRGLQSDSRFAELLKRSRMQRGYGPNYIKRELQNKGIDSELIDAMSFDEDWQSLILAVWQKKYGSYVDDDKLLYKQQQFLLYRGFSHSTIKALFARLRERSV